MKHPRLCIFSILLLTSGLCACQQTDTRETGLAAGDTAALQTPQDDEGLGTTGGEPPPTQEQPAPTEPRPVEFLTGDIGSSSRWGSGWLDLATPLHLRTGDRLRLRIGGGASKVLVRLLPRGTSPDSSVGIIGGPIEVPEDKTVEVLLDTERQEIVQISVHGGPNPWGRFPLGAGNGPATIEAAELIRHNGG